MGKKKNKMPPWWSGPITDRNTFDGDSFAGEIHADAFRIVDVDTNNVLGEYDTMGDTLRAVYGLLLVNGPAYADDLDLWIGGPAE